MEQLRSQWTDFHETWYLRIFFGNLSRNFQVALKFDNNNGYFTWRPIHILIISRSVLLRIRNLADKRCTGNQNTHFMFTNYFRKIVPFWDNVENYGRAGEATDDNRAKRIACWIPKATNTHSEYVILIALPLQQWFRERASMWRYTYIACLVLDTKISDTSKVF